MNSKNCFLLCGNVKSWGTQYWNWKSLVSMLKVRYQPGVAYFDKAVYVASFDHL